MSTTPTTISYAPLKKAVALWRGQKAISGHYRSVRDTAAMMGRMTQVKNRGTMLQISEGDFAFSAPDRFRVTGTQSIEYPQHPNRDLRAQGTIDLLFDRRTLTMVSTSSTRIPATAQVVRITEKLFDDKNPFKLKTTLRGSPFGQGDAAETVDQLGRFAQFNKSESITEGGETFTAHVGEMNAQAAVDQLIADRSQGFATTIQAMAKEEMKESFLDLQLRSTAQSLLAQRHVRVLVDEDGWIRGWDVGPTPDLWAVSLRLSKLRPEVAPDAFALDDKIAGQAVDQTPALVAQSTDLLKAYDDDEAVAAAKAALLKKLGELADGRPR